MKLSLISLLLFAYTIFTTACICLARIDQNIF